MKKIINILLAVTAIYTVVVGEEFKEVTPLENKNINVKIEASVSEKKAIEIKEEEKELEEPQERILDIGLKKTGKNEIVYANKETKPYTGKFALFLGDIVEYSETYINGVLNGPKTWYSYEGNIVLQENYIDGKIEGEQKAYYENGAIKSIVTYKNGKIIGIEALSKEGKILHKADLSKGNGEWKYFWENGQLLEEGRYKNWKKDGVWKKYRENGEVDVTTTYKNGRIQSQIWG